VEDRPSRTSADCARLGAPAPIASIAVDSWPREADADEHPVGDAPAIRSVRWPPAAIQIGTGQVVRQPRRRGRADLDRLAVEQRAHEPRARLPAP